MSNYTLWIHPEVDASIDALGQNVRDSIRKKVDWAKILLASQGMTTEVKGVQGHDVHWRRTPVKGYEYYLWWVEGGTKGTESLCAQSARNEFFLREVRHHDLTPRRLDPGTRKDYQPVDVSSIDPRFGDQCDIAPSAYGANTFQIRLVTGYPGSGKTIALLFAARDLAQCGKILYVTYTEKLAQAAGQFFQAQGQEDRALVRTLADLEKDILGNRSMFSQAPSAWKAYGYFEGLLSRRWMRKYPWLRGVEPVLWEELRAYLVGMALPFEWYRGNAKIPPCDLLDRSVYQVVCNRENLWSDEHLDVLYRIAEMAIEDNICAEQTRARDALRHLLDGKPSGEQVWLQDLRALVVDEIQDLTPLQISLLAEVARLAVNEQASRQYGNLVFLAAGDESQIVQPSGFEWPITKDLLYQRLKTQPSRVELTHQRRSPHRLAQLLNNTWDLYARTSLRKVTKQALPHEATDGKVIRCRLEQSCNWSSLLETVAESPGRAIIDLDGTLSEELSRIPDLDGDSLGFVYSPQQIKGLDRRTVLVCSLDEMLYEFDRLIGARDFRALRARHVIGAIRVALSRATETLVILERNGSEHLADIRLDEIDEVLDIEFHELLQLLAQEEFSVEDRVVGFLHEALEALGRKEFEKARDRDARARDLLPLIGDSSLETWIHQKRREIRKQILEPELMEAELQLSSGHFAEALSAINRAEELLEPDDEPSLKRRVSEQRSAIFRFPTESAMEDAARYLRDRQVDAALASNSRAEQLASELVDPRIRASLLEKVHKQRIEIKRSEVAAALLESRKFLAQRATDEALESLRRAELVAGDLGEPQIGKRVGSQLKSTRSSIIKVILEEAARYLESGNTDAALASNKRAIDALRATDEDSLQDRVQEQLRSIQQIKVMHLLDDAQAQLSAGSGDRALEINVEALTLSEQLGDPSLIASIDEQRVRIILTQRLDRVEAHIDNERHLEAFKLHMQATALMKEEGVSASESPDLVTRIDALWSLIEPQLDRLAAEAMRAALHASGDPDGDWHVAAQAFQDAADIRKAQGRSESSDALQCLAERHNRIPEGCDLDEDQAGELVAITERYVAVLESTGHYASDSARYFAELWLEESIAGIEGRPDLLFGVWLECAKQVAEWAGSDVRTHFSDFYLIAPAVAQAVLENVGLEESDETMVAAKLDSLGLDPDLIDFLKEIAER